MTLVCYHGRKYGKDKDAYFLGADLFVFPTYYPNECYPLVLLEAMQHGVPCVSTNEGGISGIIDEGENGFLTEKHDSRALAEKMEYLISHPEERKRMGEEGRRKFKSEFTLGKFEERMMESLMWASAH